MSRSVRDPQSWRRTTPSSACLSKEKAVSLTPERRDHFRRLCDSPRHNHGAGLTPVPVPTGALRELLDDGDAVDRVRELAAEWEGRAGWLPDITYAQAAKWLRDALEGSE